MNSSTSHFKGRQTLKLELEQSEYLLLAGLTSLTELSPRLLGAWQAKERCSIVLTNRLEDVPWWVCINPAEVCNANVQIMLNRLEKGWAVTQCADSELVHRICAGSSLIVTCAGVDSGKVLAFENSAVALLHESLKPTGLGEGPAGSGSEVVPQEAFDKIVRELGLPRSWQPAEHWMLG